MSREDDVIDQVASGLTSTNWSRPGHRAQLRERLIAGEAPSRRYAPGRRELVVAALVIIALGSAGTAAWRGWYHYVLKGTINGQETEFLLPVDENGNVEMTFTPADGESQTITITPDMVDADGTIRGMEWNLKDRKRDQDD